MQKVFFTQELCPSPQETPTGFYLGASILKNSPLKPLTFPPVPLYLLFASAPFIKPVPSMPHSRYLHQSIHQNTGTAIPAQGGAGMWEVGCDNTEGGSVLSARSPWTRTSTLCGAPLPKKMGAGNTQCQNANSQCAGKGREKLLALNYRSEHQ